MIKGLCSKRRRGGHLDDVNFQRIYAIFFTFILLAFTNSAFAQLQVQTTVKAARCSADGQIIVKTTGGTPPYIYQLLNSARPPQSVDTFNLLSPNTYAVRITDNVGISRDITATVTGNYQEPSIQCSVNGYTVQLMPSGGRLPYRYAYSVNETGNFTPPQYSPTFECVPIGTHTFRIYDSCDNFFSIPCTIKVDELKIKTTCQQTNGKTTITTTATSGGIPPYTYMCIRDNRDTFRNTTGNFSNLAGCRFSLTVSDKCQQKTQIINCNSLEGQVSCASFKDRTAAVYAIGGNPPYTFRSLDMTQENADGQFRNLPAGNAAYYNFEVRDSCGNTQQFTVSNISWYEVIGNSCPYDNRIFIRVIQTVPQPLTCGKGCSAFYPYRFECIDCRPVRRFVDSGLVNERSYTPSVDLTPLSQGIYRFNVFNGCGDSTQIEVVAKKGIPPLVLGFSCFTNAIKASTGLVGTTYVLKDTLNRVLATNTTGVFPSPYAGVFVIEAIYTGCDTAREKVSTLPIPTSICFGLSSKMTATGVCAFKWLLNAANETTRYQLTGGPNTIDITQTNGNFKDLEPNSTYILKTDCRIDTIKTPPANLPNLTATIFVNCTGRAIIKAEGGRFVRGCLQTYQDKYVLFDSLGVLLKSNFTGLFDSLNTGVSYQLKVQNPEGCYVQTVVLQAVVYQRPDLSATYGVICATGQTTGNIRAILRGGVPPFTFQITNPSGVYAPVTTPNPTALFPNLPVGNYTLRVVDACGVSSDFATGVGNFQFKPMSRRLCDGTLLVEVPAIDSATYKWTNTEGVVVGTTRVLETKNATAQTYSITISTPQPCNFRDSISVSSYSATGSLGIVHNLTAQYCGDSLALNPRGDTASKYVWQWQNVACMSCRNPKIFPLTTPIYYVTVTDVLTKCVIKDSINVKIEGGFTERIPNAFTPNNDGLNDNFNVLPDNCIKTVRRLRIYSRWGNLVFDKTDVSPQRKEGWDGLVNSKQLGTDVYVYIMEIEFIDGTFKKVSGEVNLLH